MRISSSDPTGRDRPCRLSPECESNTFEHPKHLRDSRCLPTSLESISFSQFLLSNQFICRISYVICLFNLCSIMLGSIVIACKHIFVNSISVLYPLSFTVFTCYVKLLTLYTDFILSFFCDWNRTLIDIAPSTSTEIIMNNRINPITSYSRKSLK